MPRASWWVNLANLLNEGRPERCQKCRGWAEWRYVPEPQGRLIEHRCLICGHSILFLLQVGEHGPLTWFDAARRDRLLRVRR